jgi:adenine deaminase
MMLTVAQRKTLIQAALGRERLDLKLADVQLVNVYTGRIEPASLGIKAGRIVTLDAQTYEAETTVDAQGMYALPGFIDTHIHVDSTLIVPENLAELIVPGGTLTLLADPMEIANVAGFEGMQALLHSIAHLPYRILIEVPSRVPTAPGLETTGGELGLDDVKKVLAWEACVSLGELDPSKVLGLRDEYLAKVEAAHALNKIANGHAAGLTGRELTAYMCGGLSDDHEAVDYDEAVARLRLGMPVLVRDGSTERNLEPIISGVVRDGLDTRHLMFCTDDKHPDDIRDEGHIDYLVNHTIELGLPAVQAIQMATLNAAIHFRVDHLIGSLSPGRWADVILAPSLDKIVPSHVFYQGQLVAQAGRLVVEPPVPDYPDWIRQTVTVRRGKTGADFALKTDRPVADVHVIELYPDQIINEIGQARLPVVDGVVLPDVEQGVLKLAVVERHGKNGNIGIAFVRGFGLKRGALASSVAHDHHNIIVAGTNDTDMAACVRAVEEMQGGLAVADGGVVLGRLPLPIGGLLSEAPVHDVIAQLEHLTAIAHDLGCTLPAPFMTISFISLPTVPELGLTDKGLVNVRDHALMSVFVES